MKKTLLLAIAVALGGLGCATSGGSGFLGLGKAKKPTYARAVIESTPLGYWRLSESSAAKKVTDCAALEGRQDGVFQGMSDAALRQPGPRPTDTIDGKPLLGFSPNNYAVKFAGDNEGGDDVIVVADDGPLNVASSGSFTVALWIKGPAAQEADAGLVAKGEPGAGGETFAIDNSLKFHRVYAWPGVNPDFNAVEVRPTIGLDDTWQHIVAVCQSGTGQLKLFINGKMAGEVKAPDTLLDSAGEPLTIGSRPALEPPYNNNFEGLIDEVAIWNRALTDEEVTVLWLAAFGECVSPKAAAGEGGAETSTSSAGPTASGDEPDDKAAEALGWHLGMQAYSFKNFTFFEAVDKTQSMGMHYIEAYSNQTISKDINEKTNRNMSAEAKAAVKKKLKDAGVKLVAFGVTKEKGEENWRALFEFCKEMGIETIVAEPARDQFDILDKLVEEYKINIALHNHPKPSGYWDPDVVLEVCKGRGKRIGACADTGHWVRSELDPIECLKKLEGRIVSLHFKDLNQTGKTKTTHDLIWGTGINNVYGMLSEIKRQGVKGVFSIEYEYNWDNSVPEIAECVKYFHLMAAALQDEGWQPLLKQDLSDAIMEEGGWAFEDDVLVTKNNQDIWTQKKYGDFVLDLEFKCAENTNSGVFIRTGDVKQWLHTAIEVQILQNEKGVGKQDCGGVFDVQAPLKQTVKAAGEWNRYIIIAKGSKIHAVLNGEPVLNMDLDNWTEAHKNPDGSKNKFNTAYKDMPREGHVGLQFHGHPIAFRNMKIKPLK